MTYLASNGLNVNTGRSDDPRNIGTHRGNTGPTMAASWDQVKQGAIRHVLKVAVGSRARRPVRLPDGRLRRWVQGEQTRRCRPRGLRLRIKPSVDLNALHLSPEALIIARALQQYGFYIGDSSGRDSAEAREHQGRGPGPAVARVAGRAMRVAVQAAVLGCRGRGLRPHPVISR